MNSVLHTLCCFPHGSVLHLICSYSSSPWEPLCSCASDHLGAACMKRVTCRHWMWQRRSLMGEHRVPGLSWSVHRAGPESSMTHRKRADCELAEFIKTNIRYCTWISSGREREREREKHLAAAERFPGESTSSFPFTFGMKAFCNPVEKMFWLSLNYLVHWAVAVVLVERAASSTNYIPHMGKMWSEGQKWSLNYLHLALDILKWQQNK